MTKRKNLSRFFMLKKIRGATNKKRKNITGSQNRNRKS